METYATAPPTRPKPSGKFTEIDLAPYFNVSPSEFGPREKAKKIGGPSAHDDLIRVPAGKRPLHGIPFSLGPEGVEKKSWLALRTVPGAWGVRSVEVPVGKNAAYVCLATFCDWDATETPPPDEDVVEKVGQCLAQAEMIYDDGTKTSLPLRRRFEVNSPRVLWGHISFNSVEDCKFGASPLTSPLAQATDWGYLQTGLSTGLADYAFTAGSGTLWVCALPNPQPQLAIKAVRLEATSEDALLVCGLTLFHGKENPLRHEKLRLYRITLPEACADVTGRWSLSVDMGIIGRTFVLPEFQPESWLSASNVGLGDPFETPWQARHLYVDLSASPEATLSLTDTKTGQRYDFDLNEASPEPEGQGTRAGARVEALEREKCWLRGQVTDAGTRRPTPVRISFRSRDGRYIPPYGHSTQVNHAWFQDYGADLQLGDAAFAYVDGTFEVELPAGDVYLEMTKGFEYEPVRKKLAIQPGQRELNLEISRFRDLRARGWVTGDTHVHFLSTSTAILEGQAEGVNLINLLASQWGDLFTNVGDLYQGPLTSRDGETLVWVGTENRQHLLGHIGLLGGKGAPAYPMCASGPAESYLGDAVWSSMAEWADACREREGLAVAVHFPYPTGEIAADIVLNKIDAVEVRPNFSEHFNGLNILDWHRYLNCGYRLPVVGGTDKMCAGMPVGGERTYAYLGQEEFSFENWARAVRRGNTFMTSGPLLLLQADGHALGDEIALDRNGGTIEVQVEARSCVPFHHLQLILNGRVVAALDDPAGTRAMTMKERVRVSGPGWLAARCSSRHAYVTDRWPLQVCAHTSPVYFRAPDQELFSASAASYMLTLIEGSLTWVENLAARPTPERFERIRQVFCDSRERLHRRLHEHGINH